MAKGWGSEDVELCCLEATRNAAGSSACGGVCWGNSKVVVTSAPIPIWGCVSRTSQTRQRFDEKQKKQRRSDARSCDMVATQDAPSLGIDPNREALQTGANMPRWDGGRCFRVSASEGLRHAIFQLNPRSYDAKLTCKSFAPVPALSIAGCLPVVVANNGGNDISFAQKFHPANEQTFALAWFVAVSLDTRCPDEPIECGPTP